MKKTRWLILLAIIVAIPFGVWIKDIENDRQKTVTTLDEIPLYSIWECGLNCEAEKTIRNVPADKSFSVLRIRNGKDFLALKIRCDDTGWLIYEDGKVKIK